MPFPADPVCGNEVFRIQAANTVVVAGSQGIGWTMTPPINLVRLGDGLRRKVRFDHEARSLSLQYFVQPASRGHLRPGEKVVAPKEE